MPLKHNRFGLPLVWVLAKPAGDFSFAQKEAGGWLIQRSYGSHSP